MGSGASIEFPNEVSLGFAAICNPNISTSSSSNVKTISNHAFYKSILCNNESTVHTIFEMFSIEEQMELSGLISLCRSYNLFGENMFTENSILGAFQGVALSYDYIDYVQFKTLLIPQLAQLINISYEEMMIILLREYYVIKHRKTDSNAAKLFPKHGISLRGFSDFAILCGGREYLLENNKTTENMMTDFVIPLTWQYQSSYCDFLAQHNDPHVGHATVFISHAWRYRFVDVLDALTERFKADPDVRIWFDLFSNNQHAAQKATYDFDWYSNTFKCAIEDIGHTILILSPWQDPIPLKRAWCLWEIFCTVDTHSQFEVLMSPSENRKFLEDVTSNVDAINSMLAIVDVQKSDAWIPDDKQRIFEAVRRTVGFATLNSTIFKLLREWFIAVHEKQIRGEGNALEMLRVKSSQATMFAQQGKWAEAEALFRECLQAERRINGEDHPNTLAAMMNLANILHDQEKFEDAELTHFECLMKKRTVLGADHASTLLSMMNLANVYADQGRFDEAEELHLACLERKRAVLGDTHKETLESITNLANALIGQDKTQEAEQLYEKCIETMKTAQGESHPDTLNALTNLATIYSLQGMFSEAEVLLERTLSTMSVKLGDDHPVTTRCRETLQKMREDRGRSVTMGLFTEAHQRKSSIELGLNISRILC